MKFAHSRMPLTDEALSLAEAEAGLMFPPGLRAHYLRVNGGVPEPYVFHHGSVRIAVSECLPLRDGGGTLSALETYRLLMLERRVLPVYFFPFAVDGGGNPFLVDCRSPDGGVFVWWHDVDEENLLDLKTGISEFWSYFQSN